MDIRELGEMIEAQGQGLERFKATQIARLDMLEKETRELAKKAGRPMVGKDSISDSHPEYTKAFDRYLRKGDDSNLADLERKAMNTGSDPDGGYMVVPEMNQTIDRIAPTVSAMYRLAEIIEIGTAKYETLVKTSGMAMRRVADGNTGGETTEPKYAKIAIEVYTAEVEPWVYNETLEDAFVNLADDLANEAGIAFAEGAGAEFITGNGVGKARGIMTYPVVENASYAWGSVGYIASGKSAAFTSVAPADAIVRLIGAVPIQYRTGASFLMTDATLNTIRQMKDGSGNYYLWQADTTAPFGGRILGFPVEIDNNVAAIGAGSYSIAFGNFKRGYAIVNRTGVSLIRDNITAKGTTKFNFRRRFGGGITNFEAIKLMKFATS